MNLINMPTATEKIQILMQHMEFGECNKLVNNNQNTMHSSENVLLIFNKFEHKSILPKNVKSMIWKLLSGSTIAHVIFGK